MHCNITNANPTAVFFLVLSLSVQLTDWQLWYTAPLKILHTEAVGHNTGMCMSLYKNISISLKPFESSCFGIRQRVGFVYDFLYEKLNKVKLM